MLKKHCKFNRDLENVETLGAINVANFRTDAIARKIFESDQFSKKLTNFQINFNVENNLFGETFADIISNSPDPNKYDDILRELTQTAFAFLQNERELIFPSATGSAGDECRRVGINPKDSNNICWLCSRPIPNITQEQISQDNRISNFKFECEHVLPFLLGAFLLKLATPDNIKLYREIINLEYKPSHHICNQYKKQGSFIKYDSESGWFELDEDQIIAYVSNLFNLCEKNSNYDFEYFITTPLKNGEVPSSTNARDSIKTTLSPILAHLNTSGKYGLTNGHYALVQALIASSFMRSCNVEPKLVETIKPLLSTGAPIPPKFIKMATISGLDNIGKSGDALAEMLSGLMLNVVSLDDDIGNQHVSQFGRNKKFKLKFNFKKNKNTFGSLNRSGLQNLKYIY